MMKKNNYRQFSFTFILILTMSFILSSTSVHAAYSQSSRYLEPKIFSSGYFWLKINGGGINGANSKIKILVTSSDPPSYSTLQNYSTIWNFKIDTANSTNNHNVKLTKTTLSTAKDVDHLYNVFRLPYTYQIKPYYRYEPDSVGHDNPVGVRLNFYTGTTDDATAGTKTYCDETREIDYSKSIGTCNGQMQVNTACCGIRTFNLYKYTGCSLWYNLYIPNKDVKRKQWATGFSSGSLNTSAENMNDSASALCLQQTTAVDSLPWQSSAYPEKYFLNNIPNGFQKSDKCYYDGASRSPIFNKAFTIPMAGASRSFSLYYEPIKYTITYTDSINDGSTVLPSNTTYTVCNTKPLSSPTRPDKRIFLGWQVTSGSVKDTKQTVKTLDAAGQPQSVSILKENYINKNNGSTDSYNNNQLLTPDNVYSYTLARTTGNITLKAIWASPPIIKTPCQDNLAISSDDNNKIKPFLMSYDCNGDDKMEKTLIFQQGDYLTPKNYEKTIDAIDGDITESEQVHVKTTGILNQSSDSKVKLYTHGYMKVNYTAYNSYNLINTRYNDVYINDPPKAKASDVAIFKDDTNALRDILFRKNTNLSDRETDEITLIENCKVIAVSNLTTKDQITVNLSADEFISTFDTSKSGEYLITYETTDNMKGKVTDQFKITVVDANNLITSGHIRFINANYVNSLDEKSIWNKVSLYKDLLTNSLSKSRGDGFIYPLNL